LTGDKMHKECDDTVQVRYNEISPKKGHGHGSRNPVGRPSV
jgi:hypothetical protein